MKIKSRIIPAKPRSEELLYRYRYVGSSTSVSSGNISGGTGNNYWELITTDSEGNPLEEPYILTKYSAVSERGLSALGLGEVGSGGGTGGVDMLQSWETYTTAKANYYAPASLLVPFRADALSRLIALESGSATSIVTTGTGNAITSIIKAGTVITANKGAKFAELGGDGLILTSQLPSYVDDVLEFTTLANFPTTGESGKIYVATGTNITYRWSGTAYVEISKSIALGTTSSTAYRGDHGLIAYNHANSEHQTIINGTGFVKANGKTLSYDNTTYEVAFSKNTAFNKNFGTAVGTVAQGNDSRINNGQTAFGWGNHSSVGYALNSALTAHTGNTTVHITANERTNWNDANSKKHTHDNKALLDLISQSNIDVLAKLSIVDGNIKVDTTLWATGGISALGLGEGGGSSGGGVDMLDDWANYTTAKADFYVPSSLLVPFRSDTLSRLTSLESGSATSIVTTGSGNAITSLTKSGSVITATKGLSFALSTHSHTIAQITGLQGALDSKASQSDITIAIDGIEIGGRNLLLNSDFSNGVMGWGSWQNTTISVINGVMTVDYSTANTQYSGVLQTGIKLDVGTYTVTARVRRSDLRVFTSLQLGNLHSLDIARAPINEWEIISITKTYSSAGTYNLWIHNSNTTGNQFGILEIDWVVITKGNTKATDWTPAPEDQVSDWNTTDVNSFAFLKNKPTQLSQFIDNIGVATHIANKANPHAVTKAQVGLSSLENLRQVDLVNNQTIGGVKSFTSSVGVGTASPSEKLHIGDGDILIDNAASTPSIITFRQRYGTTNWDGKIVSDYYGMTYDPLVYHGMSFISGRQGFDRFRWFTNDLSEMMTLYSGNLLIGYGNNPSNSTYKLDVSGTGRFTGNVTAPTFIGALSGNASSATKLTTPQWTIEQVGTELVFKYNNVIKQRMLSNGTILATGGITALST